MEGQNIPSSVRRLQQSLAPYIKKRQEASHIRRILAKVLSAQVYDGHSIAHPLSLVETTSHVEVAPSGVRGIQKEYLRCVRSNLKARNEYARITSAYRVGSECQRPRTLSEEYDDSSMHSFLDLVRSRQKYERLRIIQDYVDTLSEKPAAAREHLDPKAVLKDMRSLPQVPPEALNAAGTQSSSGRADLEELVDELEKSVLRAKMHLNREQKLLARAQEENSTLPVSRGDRLQALGSTRNELINWIETELARAGETSPESGETQKSASLDKTTCYNVDGQLNSIQEQYSQYTTVREALITSISVKLETPGYSNSDLHTKSPSAKEASNKPNYIMHTVYPYLENIVSVSNEQKAMIQQKSYLTTSLARQLKEAGQGLNRLADESHLLPAHPVPKANSQRKVPGAQISFGDEISSHEKPDSSHRAQAWVFAAESATIATRDSVSEKLESGGIAILEAQETLLSLLGLLGNDVEPGVEEHSGMKDGAVGKPGDIWAKLDGNLGVIKRDDVDIF